MIGISKLYCGAVEPSDVLRYNRHSGQLPSHLLQFSLDKKPVVVWNMTRRCNLKCIHCYSNSANIDYPDELTTEEGRKLIDDLAAFGSPVILFSGGEPLLRPDLLELAKYATDKGHARGHLHQRHAHYEGHRCKTQKDRSCPMSVSASTVWKKRMTVSAG